MKSLINYNMLYYYIYVNCTNGNILLTGVGQYVPPIDYKLIIIRLVDVYIITTTGHESVKGYGFC